MYKERNTMSDIMNKMAEILIQDFNVSEDKISPKKKLSDLGIDSLDVVDVILRVEKFAQKDISRKAFKKIKTIEDVVKAIENAG
jgi:acyl carrier protein